MGAVDVIGDSGVGAMDVGVGAVNVMSDSVVFE